MALQTFVNGESTESLLASDRGLHYGDGLFETILVVDGKPQYWRRHMRRLLSSAQRLNIGPIDEGVLWTEACQLSSQQCKAVLKIIVTRGSGGRGYRALTGLSSPKPTRIIQLHTYPDYPLAYWAQGIALRVCKTRVADQPLLAGMKHLNRLENVMARGEWEDEVPEGILKNYDGHWIEGTMSNFFCVKDGCVYTPALSGSGVLGVMREIILEKAAALGLSSFVQVIDDDLVDKSDEVFVSNSLVGIWPVRKIDQKDYSLGPITTQLSKNLLCSAYD